MCGFFANWLRVIIFVCTYDTFEFSWPHSCTARPENANIAWTGKTNSPAKYCFSHLTHNMTSCPPNLVSSASWRDTPKSSQKEKSWRRATPKKIYPLFILRKRMAKVGKKNLRRSKLLKHNFLGFKLNCVSREIRHWPTVSFCSFICDRSKRYYSDLYTLQKYYYLWKCKLVKCI